MKNSHIKQNDPEMKKVISEVGCFFRTCGLWAEWKTGKSLTARALNRAWDYCRERNWIDCGNNVARSEPIINHFLELLGSRGHVEEVATFRNGLAGFYGWCTKRHRETDGLLIQKIEQNGPGRYHFRLVDKAGNLIEDPHNPEINVKGICYSIMYHYEEKP